jgi:hypothetical protein
MARLSYVFALFYPVNVPNLFIWIEGFFLPEKVLVERQEGRHYFYKKTERGELFHTLLKKGNIIKLFNRISGRRLK